MSGFSMYHAWGGQEGTATVKPIVSRAEAKAECNM
jgi:hypothetical protein